MRKLPIGIQSFEDLRTSGYLYADKTGFIWDLVQEGKVYFLSRPRRFGKSLLISTMEAYFEGKKELFHNLTIEEKEKENPCAWTVYPVIHLSLAGGEFNKNGGLEIVLNDEVMSTADRYGLTKDVAAGESLSVRFKRLIRKLKEKTGKSVVVLVDEYDKPLLANLAENPKLEENNRDTLKAFFSVLKDMDGYLKFIFITGVTKFNKVSIFSDLNQLRDISLLPKYSAICGITEEEIEQNFSEEIENLARAQETTAEKALAELADMYDGYHFSANSQGVYNPFSLLNALADSDFGRYWFENGTPTFLIRMLNRSGRYVQDFTDGVKASEARMNNYRADENDMVPLYYETGYLTIESYDRTFREYTLSYPNNEVKYGYLESLIPLASPRYEVPESSFSASTMTAYFRENHMDLFMKMLQAFLASVPYHEGKAPENEQQWRNIIYAVFSVLGQYVRTEVHSSSGRSDCIVENEQCIYIFEFKHNKTSEEALQQIEDRGYGLPYIASGKKIVKIGANFSSKIDTLDSWKIQS